MKTTKYFTFFTTMLFFTLLFFVSCENEIEKIDEDFLGHRYYPIEVGNEWVYKVDSFLYSNEGRVKDTTHWFVKERITGLHNVGNEDDNYVLERSLSKDHLLWVVTDVWTITKTKTDLKKTEENHTFIKFVFPPEAGKSWDGNAFIDELDTVLVFGEHFRMFDNWRYQIVEKINTFNAGERDYENVFKVREVEDTSAIGLKNSFTYYAENIGLVLEERAILFDNKDDDNDKPWVVKADKGFITRRELVSYKIN